MVSPFRKTRRSKSRLKGGKGCHHRLWVNTNDKAGVIRGDDASSLLHLNTVPIQDACHIATARYCCEAE